MVTDIYFYILGIYDTSYIVFVILVYKIIFLELLQEKNDVLQHSLKLDSPRLFTHFSQSGDSPNYQIQKDVVFHFMAQKQKKGDK